MEIQCSKEGVEERRKKMKLPLMKTTQLVEFQMQALVYRYIEAGLRVPHHLLVAIWTSLGLSASSNDHKNHSFALLEAEATRCRRTDGKKWRCSNKVLPLQKYCERHMHRGSKRSRKLVESSFQAASTKHTHGLNIVEESHSVSCNAQVVTIASLPSDRVTCPSLVISESINKTVRSSGAGSYDGFIKQRDPSTCVRAVPVQGGEETSLPCAQKLFPEVSDASIAPAETVSSIRKNDIIARSKEWKNMYVTNGGLVPSIHLSPHTSLQEKEPGRCRRTDGKKWRCSKDVLSGQKYCDKHIHRGIKKKHHPVDTNSHENRGFSTNTAKTAARSMSCVVGIPVSRVSDGKRTSSCSTDTTLTDIALRGEEEDDEEVLSLCSSGV